MATRLDGQGNSSYACAAPLSAPHLPVARLFLSIAKLESWSAEGKVTVEGNRLFLTESGRAFDLKPAVYFDRVAGSDTDPHDLLGKVRDEAELATMGADHMASSVIYVDTAYDVVGGFVGLPER